MNKDEILYLVPYLLSLMTSFGILVYAWQHRKVKGAVAYLCYMAGQFFSVAGFILELISPNLGIKLLWDKFQWLTDGMIIILSFLIFSVQFTETKLRAPKLFWCIATAIPVIFNLLVVSDPVHHLIYPNPHMNGSIPFSELTYDFGSAVYIFSIYIYLAPLYGLALLIKQAVSKQGIYRWQLITISLGFFIPIAFSIFALLNISITPQRDATPFTFAIGNLIVAWGLFRFGMFEIAPIARERVIETMGDPVFVLDMNNRIVDVNSSALKLIDLNLNDVIGMQSNHAFSNWPDMVEMVNDPKEQRRELSIQTDEDTVFFDINLSHIFNNRKEVIGRTLVARDITRTKALEVSYRILSTELDQRVRERTSELLESQEKYRALFEDSPIPLLEEDFSRLKVHLEHLKASGIQDLVVYFKNNMQEVEKCVGMVSIVDVNQAAMRWYGYENKKDLQINLSQLINQDEQPSFIEELLALIQGGTRYEISASRSTRENKPLHLIISGTIAPGYEDTWGRILISIQDITGLKQAEEDLAVAYDTTLEGWAKALELKDKETEGHSRRVTKITVTMAHAMGFKEKELVDIRMGTILHDIGKMSIPDEILRKNGALTAEERKIVEKHPQVAFDLLKDIPHLKNALAIPYCHHEKWDGSGYPRGLKDEEIPLTARIFAIVDVWDALSSDRPYRAAWEKNRIIEYLQNESGKHFDPAIVTKFLELISQGQI